MLNLVGREVAIGNLSDESDGSARSDGSDFEVGVSGAGASRPRGYYDAAGAGRPARCSFTR